MNHVSDTKIWQNVTGLKTLGLKSRSQNSLRPGPKIPNTDQN